MIHITALLRKHFPITGAHELSEGKWKDVFHPSVRVICGDLAYSPLSLTLQIDLLYLIFQFESVFVIN